MSDAATPKTRLNPQQIREIMHRTPPTATLKLAAAAAIGTLALGTVATPAQAVDVEIQFTGLDIFLGFDGKRNLQTGPAAGDFDQVQSATFFVDDQPVGTIVGDIRASLGIPGFNIPVDGGTAQNQFTLGFFNIDFDTPNASEGFLDIDFANAATVTAFYTGGELGISLFGTADALTSQQPLSRVPGFPGLSPGDTITLSYVSTNLSQVVDNGQRAHAVPRQGHRQHPGCRHTRADVCSDWPAWASSPSSGRRPAGLRRCSKHCYDPPRHTRRVASLGPPVAADTTRGPRSAATSEPHHPTGRSSR